MSKISFGNIKGMLSRDEMRQVKGGSGWTSGSCAFNSGNGYSGIVGVSISNAIGGSVHNDSYWCCDSCCDVGWLTMGQKAYLGC